MLIVCLVIFIGIAVLMAILSDKVDSYSIETGFGVLTIAWGVMSVVAAFFLIIFITDIVSGITIDERIALYEEQNSKIESQISTLVEGYMDYESNTFDRLKDEDAIALISLYPELKADTLVSNQCELYIENNKNIIKLKEEKINLKPKKFLVYFGK